MRSISVFATAGNRVAAQGTSLTTLAKERARDGEALQKAYALTMACEQDVPSADPVTETSFDHFLAHAVESPNAVPDVTRGAGLSRIAASGSQGSPVG